MNRPLLIKLHLVLASFFLPVAIAFAITGGLYTFGVKGAYHSQTKILPVANLEMDEASLLALSTTIIKEAFDASLPTGQFKVKKGGTSWQFEWTGSQADFVLEPTASSHEVKATYKQTNLHRYFVQLHKAKGGFLMKLLAGGLALAFLFIFFSGVLLAFASPAMKRLMYKSLLAGAICFGFAAYFS